MTSKLPDGFALIPEDNIQTSYSQLPQGFELVGPSQESTLQPIQQQEIDGFTGAARKAQAEREYDTFTEATGKSIRNVPERFQQSAAGLIQMLGEDMSKDKERHIRKVSNYLGITPSDYRLIQWAGNKGLVDPKTPIPEALDYIKRNVTGALNDQQLKELADMSIINPDELAGFADYWREETKKTMEPVKAEPGSATYYTSAAIGSVAEMGPALLGSIVTRNPSVGMRIMAGQVGGQSYAEGREQGLSPDEAKFYALANAAAEAIPEYVPISAIIKPGQNFFKRVLKGAAAESAQEVLTEAIQLGIDKEMIKSDMTWEEARQRLIDAGIIGGIAGPVMSTIAHPVIKAQEKVNQALNTPERQLAKALNESIESTQLAPIDQAAVEALSPEKAQIKQPQDMSMLELINDKIAQKQGSQLQQDRIVADTIEESDIQEKTEVPIGDIEKPEAMPEPNIKEQTFDKAKASEQEVVDTETPVKQQVTGLEVVEAPISEIKISKDVPQFKEGADVKGVVEPLGGKFERTGVAPIQIWVRENGNKEVISGRHRLDLAERSGEKTIPAQYHYESEGFGVDQAAALDAVLNIREGQGKVKDYVEFIKATKPRKKEAEAQGLLARQTGKRAFSIATQGSDALVTAHRNDQVTDEAATRIAESAPSNESLQAVGIKAIQEGKTITVAENLVKAVKSMTSDQQQSAGDLFGFDDSAMIEAEKLAKAASKKQSEIQRALSAIQGAAKRPDIAAKEGVDVKNPKAVKARIEELKNQKRDWSNWHVNPELVAELKDKSFKLMPETEAEIQQREAAEAKAVKDRQEKDKADIDKIEADKKVDEFDLLGSDREADIAAAAGQGDLLSQPKASKSVSKVKSKATGGNIQTSYDYEKFPLEAFDQFKASIRSGTATAAEIKADAETLVKNKDAILDAMSERSFTKAMLQKIIQSPRNDLSKPQMVKQAYESMLSEHVMAGATFTIFGSSQSFEEQIIEKVRNQTQADVDKAYEKQREYRAKEIKRREEFVNAMENPKTLSDFKEFIRVRGKRDMTADQLAKYDELVSETLADEEKPVVVSGEVEVIPSERAQTKHTKTGADLFVVKMKDRVNKEKFRELSSKAKQFGGYYSSYSKGGAIPGFQFKTVEAADQFDQLLSGKDIDKSDFNEAKAEVKQSKNAEKFLDMAEKMENKANEEINQPRQANTARRASMAANATERAEKKLALAKTVRNIATRLQEGDLTHLGKLSQVTQLEELISIQKRAIPNDLYEAGSFDGYSISRPLKEGVTVDDYIANVKLPSAKVTRGELAKAGQILKGVRGYARLAAELRSFGVGRSDLSVELPQDTADKVRKAVKDGKLDKYDIGWYFVDVGQSISRIKRLGITTEEQLRAAIRELDSLRVAKRKADPIKALERDLIGKKIEGFFPTPKTLVDQMIDYADIQAGHEVLEPSAGKGNIAQEIQQAAPDAILEVVEFNSGLRAILEAKGYNVVGNDFLKVTKNYDRIVMNPPFENFQDIDHVKHAYDLLKPGGKLVAIMGAGVKNSRKKAVEFREWLDDAGSYIEDLPEGSFKTSDRPTGVSTVMVTIEKNDSNTLDRKKDDSEYKQKDAKQVKSSDRIFHAPGHSFVGLFRSTGIPERREFVSIEGRKLKIPENPQRIEPIISKLVKIMGRRIYFGKIKGKSSEGFYRPDVGEIRTRKKNDVEVLAHEMAHYLDFYSNITLPNFKKLYQDTKYAEEVKALSYTDADNKIMEIEGFAEFVRLWLTNSQEALIRAPKFYEAFTNLMARDRKLLNPMRDMQDLMHKFYFQGPDKLGQALIGKNQSFRQRFNEWAYRRDSRIRQQTIDRFHAARKVEQEITRKIGNVQESAWKQFRIANGGSEGISDYIMNYGTVNFDDKGDLKPTGKSLHEVLKPVKSIKLKPEHKGDQKIDVLLRYFAGRRALELHRQGRENLIPKETAKKWARLGKDYPVFESIQKDYQAFNDRMMDFYEESGMITAESRKTMSQMNKDYVPFNRIREQLAGGPTGAGGGFQKLKGGTANLNDILVNIQDGITANVSSALNNRAKQRLYKYISSHKDGAIFATKIAPDSKPVQVYADEMAAKIGKVLETNGVVIDGDLDLSKDLLTFWQHGAKPQLNESGNIVDSVIINGKPKYYEVQDPLLQEMLLSMNPESYNSFMNVMFAAKNIFTGTITLGVQFIGANLVRDTTGAAFLSKNNFRPFITSFKGMYSFISKDEHYQNFLRSGGGYSSRFIAATSEGKSRRKAKLDEFGVMSMPEKLLSTIDNIASAFEYGTRIGEFRLAKKNMKSDMDAGFEAREISTDFSVLGANRFLTGYIRTVPFLNAMIQSQDRVFREAVIRKKYDGNPTALAMKAFLGITVPTLILYLINKDDEEYKEIPDYEKRTNWHIKVGQGQFVKIPRPYDVGFVYATMPEIFAKYVEDDKGKEFADGMIWTLTQMYGIDGTPAMMTGWWDLVRNEKWTGAPVVPRALSDVEAPEQYTSNTAETFVRMGEALGISPVKAEHMFKAYTGYLGGYILWGTDHMLWDEEKFGEKPDRKVSDNVFLSRFLTPDVRPATAYMEKFFDLKEKSDQIVSTYRQQVDVRRVIKGQTKEGSKFKDDRFFGLSADEKEVLFALNDSMNQLIKLMYGKGGIKTEELKVKHDKNLTGAEKRAKLDQLWNSRNDAFMKYYLQADKALQKAKQASNNFKQEK